MKMIYEEIQSPADASFLVREYFQPDLNTPFHFHHEYELLYIGKSYGKLYAGNKVMNFAGGDIYFFGPGFAHCLYTDKSFIQSGQTAHAIVIQFKQDFLGADFFERAELRRVKKLLHQSSAGIKINKTGNGLLQYFAGITKAGDMHSLLLLLQMLDVMSRLRKDDITYISGGPQNAFSNYDPGKMEAVFDYIMDNFIKEVTIKKAASLACMNEAAFCRYFKRRARKTFSQFVNEVRIAHATQLLVNSNNGIADVCFESGFNNVSYFNRQFKAITGKTPFEYRKELAV
ncbi:MAG TPA: AraC family transcriptional regulator [Chitinophagaceae bacterium]|nr:AraC family transcriptional regulator [Chitinophagaceae bacterium]